MALLLFRFCVNLIGPRRKTPSLGLAFVLTALSVSHHLHFATRFYDTRTYAVGLV